jgi:molybdopterin synthase catalytic subunit
VGFAVNQEYVGGDVRPRAGDEIAFIPPVSGGAEAPWVGPITIAHGPIDVAALERAASDPAAGAIVTFAGTTRRENAGRRVIRLEYEAYEPMALSEMRKIALDAGHRWPIVRIAISHRVGVVEIGETSVAIAAAAAHRGEAFEACRFAIDRLKEIVPIWKKEYFEGGELWIGCQTSHPPELPHRH